MHTLEYNSTRTPIQPAHYHKNRRSYLSLLFLIVTQHQLLTRQPCLGRKSFCPGVTILKRMIGPPPRFTSTPGEFRGNPLSRKDTMTSTAFLVCVMTRGSKRNSLAMLDQRGIVSTAVSHPKPFICTSTWPRVLSEMHLK